MFPRGDSIQTEDTRSGANLPLNLKSKSVTNQKSRVLLNLSEISRGKVFKPTIQYFKNTEPSNNCISVKNEEENSELSEHNDSQPFDTEENL